MKKAQRALSLALCFIITAAMVAVPSVAHAGIYHDYGVAGVIQDFLFGAESFKKVDSGPSGSYASSKPQNYYTSCTSNVVDKSGNVTNYYRGGDTTNTSIIDSYNKTLNTIYNTSNTTNNYQANVKLDNFLNSYTTNNNNYTYSAKFNSWYYDNTTNNYKDVCCKG